MTNFQLILDALDKYAEQTWINLKENPFADKVLGCHSPPSILRLLQENVKEFKEYRDKNRKLIDWLSPIVQFVHAFSGILGEVSCEQSSRSLFFIVLSSQVPFQPAKLIFVGINVLFTVRVFLTFVVTNRSLTSIRIRRPKGSARATMLSLNSLNASEAS